MAKWEFNTKSTAYILAQIPLFALTIQNLPIFRWFITLLNSLNQFGYSSYRLPALCICTFVCGCAVHCCSQYSAWSIPRGDINNVSVLSSICISIFVCVLGSRYSHTFNKQQDKRYILFMAAGNFRISRNMMRVWECLLTWTDLRSLQTYYCHCLKSQLSTSLNFKLFSVFMLMHVACIHRAMVEQTTSRFWFTCTMHLPLPSTLLILTENFNRVNLNFYWLYAAICAILHVSCIKFIAFAVAVFNFRPSPRKINKLFKNIF